MSCFRLETPRLQLRPPEDRDAPSITALVGEWDVAKNLSRVPYPYARAHADDYLARQPESRAKGTDFNFAIVRKAGEMFMGVVGLHLRERGFEIGYWLGRPYWAQGYATEAARKVCAFAFHHLEAGKLEAGYFHDNPASGRVLKKIGFVPDGAVQLDCLARGHQVYCHRLVLNREDFAQKKVAA